jgi:ATP-dependent DNA helicase RecG
VLAQDTRSLKEQLAALRLYDLKNDHPTNAAIILFGKRPEYFLLGNYIQFVRFKGVDNAADITNQFEFKGALAAVLPKLDTFIETSLIESRPVAVSVLKEENKYNYPLWAVRELMMNAVMHRDYKTHTPTKLYQYADHLEITNAGGLYGNARPENFPNVNDYRNPIVAEALKIMGYVNMFNRGVARVQTLLEENGNGRANFVIDRITTFGVNIKDASFNDAVEGGTTLKTTPKTTAKIIEAIENNPYITRQEIADTLNITLDGVKWQLNKLKKEGSIKREGSSRNGKWVVIKK